jgi:hypothetical protein
MGGENLSLYTPHRTLFCHRSPSREDMTRTVPHNLGDSALSTRPRPVLDPSLTWPRPSVIEPTNYTRLSKKIIHRADDLANLSPYNLVVREIMTDFKPTYIPAKIVISLAVTITSYIKVRVANISEFKYSYYKPSSNKSSGSI